MTTAPPLAPTANFVPIADEAPARASPEPSRLSPLPRQDKGKQPIEDQQQKKKKWIDEGCDAPTEVQERNYWWTQGEKLAVRDM